MFRATCQPVEARRSPSSRLCPIPSLLVGEEWKMLCPAVVFWEALWQARNVPGPSYPARKSVQQWRPAAHAHVHRPLGGLTEGMISRRGALISLLWHAQNRFAGGSGERKGRCENRSLEKSHSSVWPVEVLDYFKHANQSRRCCTLQTDGWTGVRDQRIVEERPEPFHRRRSQPTAGSHTYCCTHTHLLLHSHTLFNAWDGEAADSRGAQRESTLLVSMSTIRATRTRLFFQEAELTGRWAKICLTFPDLFRVAALERWWSSRCRNYRGFSWIPTTSTKWLQPGLLFPLMFGKI